MDSPDPYFEDSSEEEVGNPSVRRVVGRRRRASHSSEEDKDYSPDKDEDYSPDEDESENPALRGAVGRRRKRACRSPDEEDKDYSPGEDEGTSDDSEEDEVEEEEDGLLDEVEDGNYASCEDEIYSLEERERSPETTRYQQPLLHDEANEQGIDTGEVEVTCPSITIIGVELAPEDNSNDSSNLGRGELKANDEKNIAHRTCAICWNLYPTCQGDDHHISALACGHVYGLTCIQKWFERSKEGVLKCPVCLQNCSLKDVRRLYAAELPLLEKRTQQIIEDYQKNIEELNKTIDQKEDRIEELTTALERRDMERNGGIKCQLCMSDNHDAVTCPGIQFINAKCKMPNCDGPRKLWRSRTPRNPNRVFLKCPRCEHFQWMDEACRAANGRCGSY